MSCINPRAPFFDTAWVLKLLSALITLLTKSGSSRFLLLASRTTSSKSRTNLGGGVILLIDTGWSISGVAKGIFPTGLAEALLIAATLSAGIDGAGAAAADGCGTMGASSSSKDVIWSL